MTYCCVQGESTKYPMVAATTGVTVSAARGNYDQPTFSAPNPFDVASNIFNSVITETVAGAINAPDIMQNAVGDNVVAYAGAISGDAGAGALRAVNRKGAAWTTWTAENIEADNTPYINLSLATRAYGGFVADENILGCSDGQEIWRIEDFMTIPTEDFDDSQIGTTPAQLSHIKVRKANFFEQALTRVEYLYESDDDIFYDFFDLNIPG